ncbi:cell death activator CIDE-A isoform X2 [Sphaeramia orbicularis]|uniref:Cell death activator CIDE-A-like n=1 Tax=Sphaeramia orbicularis TaxID=375764 RepID=A0A673AQ37_9TELE|nr:cell death activator CIDE-A-like isoform X2 [Sphaeramia orbicularis]
MALQSGVTYMRTFLPETLQRSLSSVHASVRHILPSAQPRCFKVCTQSRRRRRSLTASTRDELLEQAVKAFSPSSRVLTLVLEEDGTEVDSEDFFQSLPVSTALMVLEKSQDWTQTKVVPSFRQPKRSGVAKLTFDLYKMNPKDFLCCLSVRASLYDMYTLSYELRCNRMKHLLRCVLRCLTCVTRVSAQMLLYASSSLLQFTGDDDDGDDT